MGVARYEDLRVWQAARSFCQEIAVILERPAVKRDFELRNQLNDAALSTMTNIAEGFLRKRDKEFHYLLRIAAGSTGATTKLARVTRTEDQGPTKAQGPKAKD
jgi:four helix bundle protein